MNSKSTFDHEIAISNLTVFTFKHSSILVDLHLFQSLATTSVHVYCFDFLELYQPPWCLRLTSFCWLMSTIGEANVMFIILN